MYGKVGDTHIWAWGWNKEEVVGCQYLVSYWSNWAPISLSCLHACVMLVYYIYLCFHLHKVILWDRPSHLPWTLQFPKKIRCVHVGWRNRTRQPSIIFLCFYVFHLISPYIVYFLTLFFFLQQFCYLHLHVFHFCWQAGPGATIGGMCATRCSGSLAVR